MHRIFVVSDDNNRAAIARVIEHAPWPWFAVDTFEEAVAWVRQGGAQERGRVPIRPAGS